MSGKLGGMNVGLLHIRTDGLRQGTEIVQPENGYSVVRLARELPSRSKIGSSACRTIGSVSVRGV